MRGSSLLTHNLPRRALAAWCRTGCTSLGSGVRGGRPASVLLWPSSTTCPAAAGASAQAPRPTTAQVTEVQAAAARRVCPQREREGERAVYGCLCDSPWTGEMTDQP